VLSAGLISFKFIEVTQVEISLWWIGVFVVLIASILVFLSSRGNKIFYSASKIARSSAELQISTLQWLFDLTKVIENRLRNLISGFSRLLEGPGGILWALVFLVLILSILR
jgi:hypothetical protein